MALRVVLAQSKTWDCGWAGFVLSEALDSFDAMLVKKLPQLRWIWLNFVPVRARICMGVRAISKQASCL